MLTDNRQGGSRASTLLKRCLLAGRLFDDRGNLMSPSHSRKANGRRYRYYVSQAVLQGRINSAGTIRRASAEAIESLVECNLCTQFPKAKQMEWAGLSMEQKSQHVARLVERITILPDCVEIKLTEAGCDLLTADTARSGLMRVATTMKAGLGGRQIVPHGSTASTRVDRSLVKAIARARDLRHRLERNRDIGLHDLAREDGCSRPYVSSMIRLAYLAPAITQAILDGTQPPHLTLANLMQRDIPVDWTEQRRAFGFL